MVYDDAQSNGYYFPYPDMGFDAILGIFNAETGNCASWRKASPTYTIASGNELK